MHDGDVLCALSAWSVDEQESLWQDLLHYYKWFVEWLQQLRVDFICAPSDWGETTISPEQNLPVVEAWTNTLPQGKGRAVYFVYPLATEWQLLGQLDKPCPQPSQWAKLILQALSWLHDRGIAVYQLSPWTVLCRQQPEYKICLLQTGVIPPGHLAFPFSRFTAPEIRLGQADQRADLFSVGVLCYWMLTGDMPPKDGEKIASTLRHHKLPTQWQRVLGKLLAPLPHRRFADAAEALTEICDADDSADLWSLTSHRFPLQTPFCATPVWPQLEQAVTALAAADSAPNRLAYWLLGGPGCGKTRWLQQLHRLCEEHGVKVIHWSLAPINEWWPVWDRVVGESAAPSVPGDGDIALASLLVQPQAETYLHMREQTIRHLTRDGACVLLLDDLHLAGAANLDWLEALLKEYALKAMQKSGKNSWRFLVVGAGNIVEAHCGWQRFMQRVTTSYLLQNCTTVCQLSGHSIGCSEHVANMLGVTTAPQLFTARLNEITGGNPQHVRHLLACLLQKGQLYREHGEWYIQADTIDELELAGDLPDAVAVHSQQLSPAAREILQALAMAGGAVSWRFIMPQGKSSAQAAALWELCSAGWCELCPDGRITMTASSSWADLAVSEPLAKTLACTSGEHWQIEEKMAWLRITRQQSECGWNNPLWCSVWHDIRRLGLLSAWRLWKEHAFSAAETERFYRHQESWDGKAYAAETSMLLGYHELALECWEDLSRQSTCRELALAKLAFDAIGAGKLADAGRHLKSLKSLAGEDNIIAAWYHALTAQCLLRQNKAQAASAAMGKCVALLVSLCKRIPYASERLLVLYYQWLNEQEWRDWAPAYDAWLRQGLEMAQKLPPSSVLAEAWWQLAVFENRRGHYAAAMDALQKSLTLAQKLCYPLRETLSLIELASVYQHLGCDERCNSHLIQAITLCERYGISSCLGSAYLQRGMCLARQGKKEEAVAWLQSAVQLLQKHDDHDGLFVAQCELAETMDHKPAAQHYERAKKMAAGHPRHFIRLALAEAVILQNDGHAPALARITQAMASAQQYGYLPDWWRLAYQRGCARRLAGDMDKAAEDFAEAWRVIEQIGQQLPPEMRETYLASAPCRAVYEIFSLLTSALPSPTRRETSVATTDTGVNTMQQASFLPQTAALYQQEIASQRMQELRQENDILRKLLDINKKLNGEHDLVKLLGFIMDSAIEITEAERGFLILTSTAQQKLFEVARNFEGEDIANPQFEISHSITEKVIRTGSPILSTDAIEDERFDGYQSVSELKLHSVLAVPLRARKQTIGALYIDNRFEKSVFGEKDKAILEAFADQAALAIETARLIADNVRKQEQLAESHRQIDTLNQELAQLNARLGDKLERQQEQLAEAKYILHHDSAEWSNRYQYSNIVGKSAPMQEIFRVLDKVTDKNIPVLIYGESGTGKELIAKAIHFNSPRKDKKFLSENCAALTDTLLESELFGHMKGAFTGAYADKKGLFELADGGTLFLDEIGDMSPNMQAALLRVLENNVIRRVGGKDTISVDVRIISASNKDLKQLVSKGVFREDLLYRLRVVQITLPTLRQRQEDIHLLVDHFLREYAQETSTAIRRIDKKALQSLMRYDWPGNVRELRNVIYNVLSLHDDAELGEAHFQDLLVAEHKDDAFCEEMSIDEYARRFIIAYQGKYNDSQLARILGFSRKTLWEKRKKWNIFRNAESKEEK